MLTHILEVLEVNALAWVSSRAVFFIDEVLIGSTDGKVLVTHFFVFEFELLFMPANHKF